jgi:hypothetical protein
MNFQAFWQFAKILLLQELFFFVGFWIVNHDKVTNELVAKDARILLAVTITTA